MDALQKLFGGAAPVRVMRLFLLNPDTAFEPSEVAKKAAISPAAARAEIKKMTAARLIDGKSVFKEVVLRGAHEKKGKRKSAKKKRVYGFVLNQSFPHLPALRMLIGGTHLVEKKRLLSRISSAGKIKLLVLSGMFLQTDGQGRIDMLIVGDDVNGKKLERALAALESEIGKELQYAAMDTREFQYRLGVYDKFLRDILDYPHEVVVDKIGI